jgi:hypothetical protein
LAEQARAPAPAAGAPTPVAHAVDIDTLVRRLDVALGDDGQLL